MSPSLTTPTRFGRSSFARTLLACLLTITIILPAVTPMVAFAADPPPQPDILGGCRIAWDVQLSTCFAGIIYFLFVYITGFVAVVAGWFFDFTTGLSLTGPTYSNDFISRAWTLSRDLANMAFVFLLIYLAFTLILDIAHSGVGKQLAKIIAVALLINFSFFFSRVAIDASNILSHVFYDAIAGPEVSSSVRGFTSGNAPPISIKSLSTNIMAGINVQHLLDSSGSEGSFGQFQKSIARENGWINFALLASVFILFGIMNIILIFIFITAGVQMLGRIVRLWLVIMLAPIGFIAWIIPGLGSVATRWWKTLLNAALFAPAFLLGLYIIIMLIKGGLLNGIVPQQNSLATGGDITASTVATILVMIFIRLGIVIGMLFAALKIGDYFGQTGSSAIMSGARKYGGNLALKGVGWSTGYGVGGVAKAGAKRLENSRFGNSYWTGGYALRKGMEKVANKQFFGAESRAQRDTRVEKRGKEMNTNLQRVEDKEMIARAGTASGFANMSAEEQARAKQRIASLNKTEMEGLGGSTLASISHFLKEKQLETLEKSVEDGKLKREELGIIKGNFNRRLSAGREGSTEAPINEIDSSTRKMAALELRITDPGIHAVPNTNAIADVLRQGELVTDAHLDAANEALNKRLDHVNFQHAAATRTGNSTRAVDLAASKRNIEAQMEQIKKMKDQTKRLAVGMGNSFDVSGNPVGGNTLMGQYRVSPTPAGAQGLPQQAPTPRRIPTPPTPPTTPNTPPQTPQPNTLTPTQPVPPPQVPPTQIPPQNLPPTPGTP